MKMAVLNEKVNSRITSTIFPSKAALTMRPAYVEDIDALAAMILSARGADKFNLPWIKLAKFSGISNPNAANSDYPNSSRGL